MIWTELETHFDDSSCDSNFKMCKKIFVTVLHPIPQSRDPHESHPLEHYKIHLMILIRLLISKLITRNSQCDDNKIKLFTQLFAQSKLNN